MRNHARAVDFFVTVTARFKLLYVFVVMEVGSRRILHWYITEHPTAEWTATIPHGRVRRIVAPIRRPRP